MTTAKQNRAAITTTVLFNYYTTDNYTAAHSIRTAIMCEDIASKLGIDKQRAELLRRGALLHDIGKADIPKDILTKQGLLTQEEFSAIKAHTTIGHKLLKSIRHLREILPIVRHHHEWYNGRGYPDGLKGSEIPDGAAFIAVLDVYDALTNDSPYRRKYTHGGALAIIEDGIGTQFAPHLTEEILLAITDPITNN